MKQGFFSWHAETNSARLTNKIADFFILGILNYSFDSIDPLSYFPQGGNDSYTFPFGGRLG
jgi:hypothetical protein